MKRKLLLIPVLLLVVVGCTSLSTNVYRTEQTAVDLAYYGYLGYTNWLLTALAKPDLSPERRQELVTISNEVKIARLKFAATVGTVEAMRRQYDTNSALEGPLKAALPTLLNQSSNLCWLINYYRSH